MYLFFDTETSDKPRNWKAPATDLDNWPRLVQVGWICCTAKGRPTATREYLIRPEGFTISRGATAVHGITTQRARQEGVALGPVLAELTQVLAKARVLVAHNIAFDQKVIIAEFLRAGLAPVLEKKTCRCTMKEATAYCRLPGPYGYKWPTLAELYETLFEEPLAEAHSALADAETCRKCFFQLRKLGVVE